MQVVYTVNPTLFLKNILEGNKMKMWSFVGAEGNNI